MDVLIYEILTLQGIHEPDRTFFCTCISGHSFSHCLKLTSDTVHKYVKTCTTLDVPKHISQYIAKL
jgi:hypothetical protein